MNPRRFRKRPVVIEAVQIDSEDYDGMCEIVEWCSSRTGAPGCRFVGDEIDGDLTVIAIDTLEGTMYAQPGDWIIKGISGEFYPCKNAIFLETYEPVDEDVSGLRHGEAT